MKLDRKDQHFKLKLVNWMCIGSTKHKRVCWTSERLWQSVGDQAGELVLVGLTSWGPANCGLQREAGVYTSVADHLAWIQRTLYSETI